MEPFFVVDKIIGSSSKNDSLLFHSKLYAVWLWPLQSSECDYDHYKVLSVIMTITVLLRLATHE